MVGKGRGSRKFTLLKRELLPEVVTPRANYCQYIEAQSRVLRVPRFNTLYLYASTSTAHGILAYGSACQCLTQVYRTIELTRIYQDRSTYSRRRWVNQACQQNVHVGTHCLSLKMNTVPHTTAPRRAQFSILHNSRECKGQRDYHMSHEIIQLQSFTKSRGTFLQGYTTDDRVTGHRTKVVTIPATKIRTTLLLFFSN